jgi:hypothetical protein
MSSDQEIYTTVPTYHDKTTIKISHHLEHHNSRYKNDKPYNVNFLIYQGQIKTLRKQ